MSDTPETDAVDGKPTWQADIVEVGWVQSDFARRLERERDSERALADRLAEALSVYDYRAAKCMHSTSTDVDGAIAALAAWKESRGEV